MNDPFLSYRRNSRGFMKDSPAKVHSNIIFGSKSHLNLDFIIKNNITHVINCATDADTVTELKEKLFYDKYVCINALDSYNVNITDWYSSFENVLSNFLKSPSCRTVYVHCQAGVNRSAFLTALYCCLHFHYPYDTICKAILLQRPCAMTNIEFHKQVQDYIELNNNGKLECKPSLV